MTLRLVYSRTMGWTEISRRIEKAVLDLSDAQIDKLSLRRRFEAAYEAAYECALAFSGIMNLPIPYGDRCHREAFRTLLRALNFAPGVSRTTTRIVNHHYLEDQLSYRGETRTDEAIVLETIEWAHQLQAAVLEAFTSSLVSITKFPIPPTTC